MTDKKAESLPQGSPTLSEALDTIEYMRKERVRAEEREAALREEIATLKSDADLVALLGTPDQFAVDQERHRMNLRMTAAEMLLAASHTHVKQVAGTGIGTARILAAQIEAHFDERRELARLALSHENQRITPATPMQAGYKCLACGDVHGGLGLPCPKMAPMSGVKLAAEGESS